MTSKSPIYASGPGSVSGAGFVGGGLAHLVAGPKGACWTLAVRLSR